MSVCEKGRFRRESANGVAQRRRCGAEKVTYQGQHTAQLLSTATISIALAAAPATANAFVSLPASASNVVAGSSFSRSTSISSYLDLDGTGPDVARPSPSSKTASGNGIPVQKLFSDPTSKQLIKKPRVLFFHGEYTNEHVSAHLLKMMGYDAVFDFVVPPAMYEGIACPQHLQAGLELRPLVKTGLYPLDGNYFKWGAQFERMEEDSSSFKEEEKAAFQSDLMQYVTRLDKQYGPFDGVMGFCEGGAALNTVIGMQEQGQLNGALDSAKFFVHMAPWATPLGGDYTTTAKKMPTLAIAGTRDFEAFQRANTKYHQGFKGYYDRYSHNGQHNYPVVNAELLDKLLSLIDESTDEFLVENWEYVCDDEEGCLPVRLTDEQEVTCLDFIAEISCVDAGEFTLKTTLFDELEMDSLDVTEFFHLLKEEFEGGGENLEPTNAAEMRIFGNRDGATVQHLLDEAALILVLERSSMEYKDHETKAALPRL